MSKGHSLSVLLIAVFGVIFVPSIQAGPWDPIGSAVAGLHGSVQVGSGGESVAISGLGAGTHMVQFKAGGHLLGFQPRKVYFASLDHALSVEFLGTPGVMPKTTAEGGETGNKPKVPTLRRVVYEELWEGISLTYEAREGGIAESTYHIGPWADVSKIRLGYNAPVEVQGDGSLKFKFDRGYLTESPPEAWQEIGGERVPVAVAFRVTGREVGFSVGPCDPNYPLTIDPTYAWHAFYGSSNDDQGYAIAIDGSGDVYITGGSESTWNGPAGQSPLHAHSGNYDIFVLKLDSSGAYQWHTFYGSSDFDYGRSIAAYGNGNVYVTGLSNAAWYGSEGQSPLHAYSGGVDIFVLKLDSGGAYQWHTFYPGSTSTYGDAIAIDGSGNVYVTGTSSATWNGPAGQNPLHAHSGFFDIVVLKLDSGGSYQWHTFYGSTPTFDYGYRIAADESGNLYVTGRSDAAWYGPEGQSSLHAHSGFDDIFVLKLDSSGTYQWHTFYGSNDGGLGIVTDGSGNVYVTGYTDATWNGPAGQSPLHAHSGFFDIVVLKLDSSGSYQWHTFYGSSNADEALGIVTDASGNVYVTGYTDATWNGPAGQSPLHAYIGGVDIFVLKLNSSGSYESHTFYGSSNYDGGNGIATDASGNVYVTGPSGATWNGPAGQSPLHAHSGNYDIFVLKLSNVSRALGWDISTIDSAGDVGPDSSIAIDSNNKVHISYLDNVNADLKYATNASGSWQASAIDGAGNVGIYTSVATDLNNKVHISYYDATNGDLKYATNTSGSWETSTIDSAGDVGRYTSITIDSNNGVHISYCDYTNFDLKYATNASGSWQTFTVDSTGNVGKYTSIGVDSNDNVHIGYIDNTNWDLKYATNASGLWITSIVDGSVGIGIAMAIDSNNKVHISYPASFSSALKYATNALGSWVTSTIDNGEGIVGDYSSIAIDSNNKIHISYFDNTNADLKYATNISGSWVTSILDSAGIVGGFTSIAIDSNNKAHISYYDGTNGDLKYATNASRDIIDFDGDRKTDIAVYRVSTGAWWIIPSSTGSAYGVGWGGDPSDIPVTGDYDGDRKSDIAFYRGNTGTWWIIPSSGVGPQGQVGAYGVGWGGSAFKPVPGDYDGDGKTDIAIYDTASGGWWIIPSSGTGAYGVGWGGSGFKPVPGDYDGDTKTDIAIYDTTGGAWWIIPSSGIPAYGVGWGGSAFKPVPGDYDGDGKTDIAIYDNVSGAWWIIPSSGAGPQGQVGAYGVGWGGPGFTPVTGDYDGDGKTDIAIYQGSTGAWWIIRSTDGSAYGMGWGGDPSDLPTIPNPGS